MSSEALPEILYHYTHASGFLGIVEHGMLWASSIRHLNDSAEYHHASETFEEVAQGLSGDAPTLERDLLLSLPLQYRRQPNDPIRQLSREMTSAGIVFVACFSGHRDDLSQWRRYGERGVAIAFDTTKLQEIADQQGLRLAKCVYSGQEKVNLAREELNRLLERFRQLPDGLKAEVIEVLTQAWTSDASTADSSARIQALQQSGAFEQAFGLAAQFASGIDRIAPILKHTAFQVEDEYRLIATVGPFHAKDKGPGGRSCVKFRPGTRMAIPYIEIALESLRKQGGFRSVMIGPTSEPALALVTYKQMMECFEFPYGGLGITPTPYREPI